MCVCLHNCVCVSTSVGLCPSVCVPVLCKLCVWSKDLAERPAFCQYQQFSLHLDTTD